MLMHELLGRFRSAFAFALSAISVSLVTQNTMMRLWVESNPEVPVGDLFKDFGSFKPCGEGIYPKTFLLPGQSAHGTKL